MVQTPDYVQARHDKFVLCGFRDLKLFGQLVRHPFVIIVEQGNPPTIGCARTHISGFSASHRAFKSNSSHAIVFNSV